ncbi:MarR family winged helix-turn-helix transcriptional regulator [Roseivivax sediminis]|uniref:DNA-binding transcriptional regulator, MarR family n=1 Tax=Roseivivax sediminis TaxID=936889 RepID=A0A1I2BLI1_9RHOB|nr:MarR family transcriptional regulator [Roseivivax sediminis]SFE56668.1 DNA-binding transcriptional regulator, MarR family [Roseivivax sediminis]
MSDTRETPPGMDPDLPLSVTLEVRDRCLCLHLQRAARIVARRFDEALAPLDLSNKQFSVLMALNRPDGPRLGALVEVLGMDRTTLTAALKPLERRGLVESSPDPADARARRLRLTPAGQGVLKAALPVWRETHDAIDAAAGAEAVAGLTAGLAELAGPEGSLK